MVSNFIRCTIELNILMQLTFLATPVHWVPIVDRNSDDVSIDPIEAAFRKTKQMDQIHQEKVVRIAKMLNVNLATLIINVISRDRLKLRN
jgi:hypothetical protein